MTKFIKLNDHKIGGIPDLIGGDKNELPVRGSKLITELYANICIIGRKESGKTSLLFLIIKECIGKNTKVYLFGHTMNKDTGWLNIQKWLSNNGIHYEAFDKIEGNIEPIVAALQKDAKDGADEEPEKGKKARQIGMLVNEDPTKKKEKKPKFATPEIFFVFDDINLELRSKPIRTVLSENRHWKSKMLFSTHSVMNLFSDEARKLIDVYIVYQDQLRSIEEIWKDKEVPIPLDKFIEMYKQTTSKVMAQYKKNGKIKVIYYPFYIDRDHDSYRMGVKWGFNIKEPNKQISKIIEQK